MKSIPFLNEFKMKMLILPHSSVCAERTVTSGNPNKTKLRNKFGFTTTNALLGAKRAVTKDWTPPMSMLTPLIV